MILDKKAKGEIDKELKRQIRLIYMEARMLGLKPRRKMGILLEKVREIIKDYKNSKGVRNNGDTVTNR